MKKLWNMAELPYIIAVAALGSLNHFIYEWSGENAFAALFCPVSESVWEHLKLLFFPYLFAVVWIYFYERRSAPARYFCSRFLAVLIGMAFIVISFYTYTGIIGQSFVVIDILIFFAAVLAAFRAAPVLYRCPVCKKATSLIFAGWIFAAVCFFFFTCQPPNLPLFFSPS